MSNAIETGTFQSRSDYQRHKYWHQVFAETMKGYRDVLAASPLVASTFDDEIRPRRLGPELIHYRIDIERATEKALSGRPDLLKVWVDIVEEAEGIPANVYSQIASRCGRFYSSRKLTPCEYYRTIKKGRKDRRAVIPSEAAA